MAYGELIKCKCAVCETEWETTKSKVRACCSRGCSEKLRIEKMKATKSKGTSEKPCVVCGNMFEFNPGTKRGQSKKTCSKSCQSKTPREYAKGASHHMKKPEQREKVKRATISKYGGIGMAVPELYARARETMLEKYGVEHALQIEGLAAQAAMKTAAWGAVRMDKAKATNIIRYGAHNPMMNPDVSARASATRMSKRRAIYALTKTAEWWQEHYIDSGRTISQLCDDHGIGGSYATFITKKLGISVTNHVGTSAIEKKLQEAIAAISGTLVLTNDKTLIGPKELDVYIPAMNLAVEVNGLYWHSEISGGKGKTYHGDKMRACSEKGVELIQFWDTELTENFELCMSMIKSRMGMNRKIHARSCVVGNVGRDDAKAFVDKNHISGYRNCAANAGLYHDGELVAVMSTGRSRYRPGYTEIFRFCTAMGYTVVGGFGKLLKTITGPVVSYSDNRYSTGKVYAATGFTMSADTGATPWYTRDYGTLRHRSVLWGMGDASHTQWDAAVENGWDRVWDAGQKTWILVR